MSAANKEAAAQICARLSEDEELLARFLEEPNAVAAEIVGAPVDQVTLEAVGHGLSDALKASKTSELSDPELEAVAGGFGISSASISQLKPTIGRSTGFSFSYYITAT